MTTPRLGPLTVGLLLLSVGGCGEPKRSAVSDAARAHQASPASEMLSDQPPTPKTLYSMALILATQGKDGECEFVLRRCVQEHPEFTPAYNSLAELQMRQGRIHQAIDTLASARKIGPRDPVLSNNLGMCLLLRKEYAQALACFTAAAGLVPESEKYRANMATALGLLGRQEEALALFQQVVPQGTAENNAELLRQAYEKATHATETPSPPA